MRHLPLLIPTLLLAACASPRTAPAVPAPNPVEATPGTGTPAPVLPARPALTPLGLVQIEFTGVSDQTGFHAQQLRPQGLTDLTGIQLEPLANGSFTLGTRGSGGMRYLYATFRVRNASTGGVASSVARRNVTLVAASTPSTIGETAISGLQRFDGTAGSAAVAPTILPTHGMTLDRTTDQVRPKPGSEDLQVFPEDEVNVTVSGATRVFPYGFVIRNRTTPATRLLSANPAANQFDGVVTVALKVPLQATVADDPFRFTMNFAVLEDSLTRVTESPEEQGTTAAATRATTLGATTPVMTLCGTTLTSNALFVGSATTAGNTSRLAALGGQVALKNSALAYSVPGNVQLNVPAGSGLGSAYSAYGGASLTFNGNSSQRTGRVNVSMNGSFTYESAVGDGATPVTDKLNYSVSDGQGCTSPTTQASVNVSGRVWFLNNAGAAGDGRQTTPLNTLAALQNASAAGDTLYVFRGTGTTSNQNTGLTLKANQSLIGEGSPLTIGGVTYRAAGATPLLGNSGGAGLTLAQNNTVQGVAVQGVTGISGTNFGTLTIPAGSGTRISGNGGPALNLTTGTLNATLQSVSSSGATITGGLTLTGVGGTLSVTGAGAPGTGGLLQLGQYGVLAQPGTQTLTLSLDRMQIENNTANGIRVATASTETGRVLLTVQNSTFTQNAQAAVFVKHGASSASRTVLKGNTIQHNNSAGGGIEVITQHTSAQTDELIAQNNIINLAGGMGIQGTVQGSGTLLASATGNTVQSFGNEGMWWHAQGSNSRVDATVQGNTLTTSSAIALDGILLQSSDAATTNSVVCGNVTGNTVQAAGAPSLIGDISLYIVPGSGNQVLLQGLSGSPISYLTSRNTISIVDVSGSPVLAGNCTLPTP
ncbi:right-handed parallel beta-helix repeat-containing protein [Deinococcus radiotolerans]|uniref:Right handed beta helix domain-containing protein n=1 Tax=Deinococcus radiotolerans TaxID=1309407 RepID=A0ABQ2FRM5_9DEIO|nr:right-handed parallel beta-helix repeat-containing protein [Deinococcus radiotolerans]GGL19748.1 hypothetical protein GCM10010844_43400 [Deinococcus radiotolerans]